MIQKICHSILGHTCSSKDTHAIAICFQTNTEACVWNISGTLWFQANLSTPWKSGKNESMQADQIFLVIWVFFLHLVCSNNATSTLIILRNCLSKWETVFEERKMQCFFMKSYGHMTIQSPDLLIISSVRDNIDELSPFPFLYSNEAKWE